MNVTEYEVQCDADCDHLAKPVPSRLSLEMEYLEWPGPHWEARPVVPSSQLVGQVDAHCRPANHAMHQVCVAWCSMELVAETAE